AGAAGPELLPNGVAPPDLDILFGLEAGANYRDVGARHDGALFKGVFGKLTTAGLHRDLRTVPAASGLDSRLCALTGVGERRLSDVDFKLALYGSVPRPHNRGKNVERVVELGEELDEVNFGRLPAE